MHEHMCASVLVVLLDGKFFIFLFFYLFTLSFKIIKCVLIYGILKA